MSSDLCKGILGGYSIPFGWLNATSPIPRYLKMENSAFPQWAKRNRAMVADSASPPRHAGRSGPFRDGEDADPAEGAWGDRGYLSLRDVSGQAGVGSSLEAVEGNRAGDNIPFQCSTGEVDPRRPPAAGS